MTKAALGLCGYMVRHLTRCDATVMTHRAIVEIYVYVVIGNAGESREIDNRMAGRTIGRGRYMINRLADGNVIVMARGAIVNYTGVIEHAGGEGACGVADTAVLGGR